MNNVCFCFPFPFFPAFGPVCTPSPSTAADGSLAGALALTLPPTPPPPPAPQAATAGAVDAPRIFFSDTFPFTCGTLALELDDVGNSGNNEFDNFGGACLGPERPPLAAFIAGPVEETTVAWVRSEGGVAELADHGVAR